MLRLTGSKLWVGMIVRVIGIMEFDLCYQVSMDIQRDHVTCANHQGRFPFFDNCWACHYRPNT